MKLARFPRVRLTHAPTPLEPMPNLTRLLGGPKLWIKRDDCTGLATGGNKTRKLEYLMGEALAQKADVVITQGATQSNHARQTAAAAAKLGLGCEILLEDRTGSTESDYRLSGNVLLDRLHGATVARVPGGTDMDAAMTRRADELRSAGRRPYVIPGGGSNPVGALGYVTAALELVGQANDTGLDIDLLVTATGSTGTQAGLLAGLQGCRSGIPVLGICVRSPKDDAGGEGLRARAAHGRAARHAGGGRPQRMWSRIPITSVRATACRPRACSARWRCWLAPKASCSTRCTPARRWPG